MAFSERPSRSFSLRYAFGRCPRFAALLFCLCSSLACEKQAPEATSPKGPPPRPTAARAADLYAKGGFAELIQLARGEAKEQGADGTVLYYGFLSARAAKDPSEGELLDQARKQLVRGGGRPTFEAAPHCYDSGLTSKDGSLRWVHCLGHLFVVNERTPEIISATATNFSWTPSYAVDPSGQWIATWLSKSPNEGGGTKLVPPPDTIEASRFVYLIPLGPGAASLKFDVEKPLYRTEDLRVTVHEDGRGLTVLRDLTSCRYRTGEPKTCVDYSETNRDALSSARATIYSQRGPLAQVRALAKDSVLPATGEVYYYWDLERRAPFSAPRPVLEPEYHFSSDPPPLPRWEALGSYVVEAGPAGVALIAKDAPVFIGKNTDTLDFDDFELGADKYLLTWGEGEKEEVALFYDLEKKAVVFEERKSREGSGYSYGEPEVATRARERAQKMFPTFGAPPATEPTDVEDSNGIALLSGRIPLRLDSAALSKSDLVYTYLDPNRSYAARLANKPEEETSLADADEGVGTLTLAGSEPARHLVAAEILSTVRRAHDHLILGQGSETTLLTLGAAEAKRPVPQGAFDVTHDGAYVVIRTENGPQFQPLAAGSSERTSPSGWVPRRDLGLGLLGQTWSDDYDYGYEGSFGSYVTSDSTSTVGFEKDGEMFLYQPGSAEPVLRGKIPRIRGYYATQSFSVQALLGDGKHMLATGYQGNTAEYYRMLETASMGTPTDILASLAKRPVDCRLSDGEGPYVLSTEGSIMERDFGGGRLPVATGDLLVALRLDGLCVWNWKTGTVYGAIPVSPQEAVSARGLTVDERGFVLLSTATGIWIYSLHDPSVALRVRPLGNGASVVDDLTQGVTEVRGEVAGQLFCRIGEKLYDAALCSARGGSGLLAPLL